MEIQTRILSMEIKNAGNGQNTKTEVGIGDDVYVKEQEINTIRPKIVIPDKDERRGK